MFSKFDDRYLRKKFGKKAPKQAPVIDFGKHMECQVSMTVTYKNLAKIPVGNGHRNLETYEVPSFDDRPL